MPPYIIPGTTVRTPSGRLATVVRYTYDGIADRVICRYEGSMETGAYALNKLTPEENC